MRWWWGRGYWVGKNVEVVGQGMWGGGEGWGGDGGAGDVGRGRGMGW